MKGIMRRIFDRNTLLFMDLYAPFEVLTIPFWNISWYLR